ncbi:MAG: hypothetical protein WKG01_17580 [Kofleriaceae bacterium]
MRALLCLLAACSPDIASGTYTCGPDGLCPPNQRCDGVDDVCVEDSYARDFTCETAPRADDTAATGTVVPDPPCVMTYEASDCLDDPDRADWFQLDVPASCTNTTLLARVVFRVAYQPLAFVLPTGAATETPCTGSLPSDAYDHRCYAVAVAPGSHHAIAVGLAPGAPDCEGACAYNRYALTLRLATP